MEQEPAWKHRSIKFSRTLTLHVEFLESIRDKVHNVAEAKRLQLVRGYSDQTLSQMLAGIPWSAASEAIAQITELPTDAIEQVACVLRRGLTVGTVEKIDAMLTPAVMALRDAFEEYREGKKPADDPAPPKNTDQGTSPGEGHEPSKPANVSGFMSAVDLATALGIATTRREAFVRQLRRARPTLGDDAWREVSNPHPNAPRYLYLVESPAIKALAARYKVPGPA